MPHSVPAEYISTKNAQFNKPINLYTIYDYDGASTNLNFAEHKTDIVFNGVTYSKFPIMMEAVTENVQGEIDAITIRVSNVSRVIQYYLENYDLRGKKISIKQVWADQLEDIDNVIEYIYYIDRYTSGELAIDFECSSKFDVADVQLPFGRFMRGVCRWKTFKGTECGYSGAETSCDRTMTACRARGNIVRFGGFPSVPTQRTFVS